MKHFFILFFLIVSQLTLAQKDFALAENYYRNNEFEKAIQIYKKLADKSPLNVTYIQRLISSYHELNQFYEAEKELLVKLKKHSRSPFYTVLLGYNYEKQHKLNEAQKHYRKALNSIPKNMAYASIIAKLLKNYNQLDLAIEAYDIASEKNPKKNFSFQKAQIYGEKGDFDKMFQSYVSMIRKNTKNLKTVQRYAAKYITEDSESETNLAFKKALLRKSASNPKPEWNVLLSWLFIQQKEYSKALIQEKALFAREADNLEKILNLGEIAFNNKDFNVAKKCFDFVLEKSNYIEDKFNAIYMNLKIAVVTKEPDVEKKFQKVFNDYGKNENTLSIQVAYADYLTFNKNQPQKAQEVLEEAMTYAKSKFQKAQIKLKLGDVLVFTGKFNKALIYFSQVQTKLKSHFLAQEARFKVAQTSYFKGDFDWAKAQLKVLKGSATQLIANDAVDLYVIISDNQPKDSVPSGLKEYAKADLLAYQNKDNEAIAILENIVLEYKGQPVEDEALFKQGKLLLKQKKYDEAILTFANVVAIDAEGILNDDVYFVMAEMYKNDLNLPEKAQEYYQKIIFEHPSSIYLVDARKKFRKLRGDEIN